MPTRNAVKERRASQRVPVSVKAVLYYNSLMLPDCHIRDLSSHGAFVLTPDEFLPIHASVDLSFDIPEAYGISQRVEAKVMRKTAEGVGLRLSSADPRMLEALGDTLYVL
jgi:hypothetical protein